MGRPTFSVGTIHGGTGANIVPDRCTIQVDRRLMPGETAAADVYKRQAYSAGPLSPKHRALGEVWAFLFMGVGLTLGGYMAQTGTFSWGAIAAGVPAGLLMTLLLYTNNLRDLASDRAAGLRTLPMLFKPVEANIVAGLFLIFPFFFTGLMAGTRQLPQGTLWCLLTLPLALHLSLIHI